MSAQHSDQDVEDSLIVPSPLLAQVILTQLNPVIYSHKLILFLDIDLMFLFLLHVVRYIHHSCIF